MFVHWPCEAAQVWDHDSSMSSNHGRFIPLTTYVIYIQLNWSRIETHVTAPVVCDATPIGADATM